MHPRTRTTLVLVAVPALLVAGAWLWAGPINPPAGPVAPSYKTMTEVQPRTAINAVNTPGNVVAEYNITQPGSYYLTGNITTGKTTAISVNSISVTIDLNGFLVTCTSSSPYTIINAVSAAAFNVHDGRLTGSNAVNGVGVFCVGDQAILRKLSITCGGQAINVGINPIIEDVAISSNDVGATSIACGAGAQVRRTAVNGAGGITVGDSSLVQESIVRSARSAGITAGANCTITGCNSNSNIGTGINTGDNCTITGCTAASNTSLGANGGIGMATGANCTITGCTAASNASIGMFAGTGCTISGCTVGGNGTGILLFPGIGGTITGCTVSGNAGDGISAGQGATISNCTVRFNTGNGIYASTQCLVIGNMCANNSNGGSGIWAGGGGGNRVEANNCVGNGTGIRVSSNGNVIIKNTCSGNTTNWNVVAGNTLGPIAGGVNATLVNSNFYPGNIGSTDPNANFAY